MTGNIQHALKDLEVGRRPLPPGPHLPSYRPASGGGHDLTADDLDDAEAALEFSLPLAAIKAATAFLLARAALEKLIQTRVAALEWQGKDILNTQDARAQADQIQSAIADFEQPIAAARATADTLRDALAEARLDPQVAHYQRRKLAELDKTMAQQALRIKALDTKIANAAARARALASRMGTAKDNALP